MDHKPKFARAIAVPHMLSGKERASEYIDFLAAWLRKPRQTASVVPSSRYLARLMASQVDPQGGRVIELGGGTGAFTRAILETGLPSEMLEVVEVNPAFARNLRRRFPEVQIVEQFAQSLHGHVRGEANSYQQIVSGLPLLAMDRATVAAILRQAFDLLVPGGKLIQFTYSPRPPVHRSILEELGLRAERVGQVVRNVPPATVFAFSRRNG